MEFGFYQPTLSGGKSDSTVRGCDAVGPVGGSSPLAKGPHRKRLICTQITYFQSENISYEKTS